MPKNNARQTRLRDFKSFKSLRDKSSIIKEMGTRFPTGLLNCSKSTFISEVQLFLTRVKINYLCLFNL